MLNKPSHSEFILPSTKSSKTSWPIWMVYLFLITPSVLPVGIDTALMGYFVFFPLVGWLFSQKKTPVYVSYITLPLVGIISIGLVGYFINPPFDVTKDIWYVGNIILTFLAGFILMYNLKDFPRLSRTFVIAAVLISLLHLFKFVLHPEYLALPANDLREVAGKGNLISILGVGLLIVSWLVKTPLFNHHKWINHIAFGICLTSIGLSFSRDSLVSLVLLVACIYGWIDFNNTRRLIKVAIATTLLVGTILVLPAPTSTGQNATLIDKVLYSANELKVKDYNSIQAINANWRGYETARALKTYSNGNYWQYIVGQGFGTSVDLGLYMQLGEDKVRFAPILHNGYMYLLVKTGVAGLALYLLMILLLMRLGTQYSHSADLESKYVGRLTVGMGFIMILSTYVVAGLLNKQALISVALLTGALVAYASNHAPQKQANQR